MEKVSSGKKTCYECNEKPFLQFAIFFASLHFYTCLSRTQFQKACFARNRFGSCNSIATFCSCGNSKVDLAYILWYGKLFIEILYRINLLI